MLVALRPPAALAARVLFVGSLVLVPVRAADTPVRLRAVAVNLSNVGTPGPTSLEIVIERWTSPDEFARLRDALAEKGSDGLMKELQNVKPRVGSIRTTGGGLGWDLQFAQETALPGGGRRIVFATDRPMSFHELANRPRSADYDFLLGEVRLGADGKGEGKLVPMARIAYDADEKMIEVENYANAPLQLTEVTVEK
jgi:hypothetical protein